MSDSKLIQKRCSHIECSGIMIAVRDNDGVFLCQVCGKIEGGKPTTDKPLLKALKWARREIDKAEKSIIPNGVNGLDITMETQIVAEERALSLGSFLTKVCEAVKETRDNNCYSIAKEFVGECNDCHCRFKCKSREMGLPTSEELDALKEQS